MKAKNWTLALFLSAALTFPNAGGAAAGLISEEPDALIDAASDLAGAAGMVLSGAGDINGDGFDDLAIADGATGGFTIYPGSAQGLSASSGQAIASPLPGNNSHMESAGDVNGDGCDDFLVLTSYGEGYYNWGNVARLYYGSTTGLSSTAGWEFGQDAAATYFSRIVGGIGDVNGDSFGDFLVTSSAYSPEIPATTGAAAIFHGSRTGPAGAPALTITAAQQHSHFPFNFAPLGDRNGDSRDDLVLLGFRTLGQADAAPYDMLFLHDGGEDGLSASPSWTLKEESTQEILEGPTALAAGDANGDGYPDLLLGAPFAGQKGKAHLLYGTSGGFTASYGWTFTAEGDNSMTGGTVALADVNGDGISDGIVGSRQHRGGGEDPLAPPTGRVFVFLGRRDGPPETTPSWTIRGNGGGFFGDTVVTGDWNGDGTGDLAVVQKGSPNGTGIPGSVAIFYGRGLKPVFRLPSALSTKAGTALSVDASAESPYGDIVTVTAQNLPAGAVLNGATLAWTPLEKQAGVHRVTFTASDGFRTASKTLEITVLGKGDGLHNERIDPLNHASRDFGCLIEALAR